MRRKHSNSKSQFVQCSSASQSGQTLLEVALLTPLLLLLLLGVIEMGRYAYIGILVGNAAHAGAMYGSENVDNSGNAPGIQTAADNDFVNNGQSLSNLTVSSTTSCGCDNGGTISGLTNACSTKVNPTIADTAAACSTGGGHWVIMCNVEASGTFSSLFSYPGIPSSIKIDRTATMRVAQ
ncbi:MAG TPA: TadE/TadG family type IV pilus assembly protein [Candidatus Acidoferrales bacterium]|nr:TadE/TadG family type IV pilus assembly protein [Candidatus Acidoferrales bacterium]